VVVADSADGPRVAILHRREPAEWRLAKGKLHAGETHEQAAQREVAEELGLEVQVGPRLGETRYGYRERGAPVEKTVVFYLTCLLEPAALTPEERNFDQALWASPEEALRLLTWENERKAVLLGLVVAGAEAQA